MGCLIQKDPVSSVFQNLYLELGLFTRSTKSHCLPRSACHFFPEQTVQVGYDVKSSMIVPIHWAKYNLAFHKWKEPIERFTKEARKRDISFLTPQIGEIIKLPYESVDWWKDLE